MTGNTNSITEIWIDLSQSGDAVRFDTIDKGHTNLIQQEARGRVLTRIDAILDKVDEFKNGLETRRSRGYRPRSHDVITISGGRGSGKTTFILNLFEALKDNAEPKAERDDSKKTGRSIEVLSVIDPTLIESKENILVTIISLIKLQVDAHARRSNLTTSAAYKDFHEKLRNLARGLQLLDSIGPKELFGDDWADPAWVLENGLKNAQSGTDFEAALHGFINSSLGILNKKAFLLAFDDIDTSFERGWPVLETIRKYLTTPQLIVLLSGDLKLYARLVRRQQFENLGQMILQNDRPHANHHTEAERSTWRDDGIIRMVNTLEDQYLLKIMKPENRVSLLTLDYYQHVLADKYQIYVRSHKETDQPLPTLSDYIADALKRHMLLDRGVEDVEVFRSAILRQPVRTGVQLLIAASEADKVAEKDRAEDFLDRLIEIGAAALFHMDLSPEDVRFADGPGLLWLVDKWIERNDLWDEGYRLVPNHRDDDINMVSLVFGGRLASAMRSDAALPLLYILQVSLLRELKIASWPGQKPDTQMLMRYLDLEHVEKPSTIARRLVAAIRSMRGGESFRHQPALGTIPISGASFKQDVAAHTLYGVDKKEDLKQKTGKGDIPAAMVPYWEAMVGADAFKKDTDKPWHFQVTMNTLNSLRDGLGANGWIAGLPALILPDPTNRQTAFYSIFSLLGLIAELMALKNPDEKAVAAALARLGQIRTYPLPPWAAARSGDFSNMKVQPDDAGSTSESDAEDESDLAEQLADLPMAKALTLWLKRQSESRQIRAYHPHVIARIGTRFIYTLQRSDDEIKATGKYLGSLIHRQIVAFLNAVLVEERLALRGRELENTLVKMDDSPLDFTNPTLSDLRFLRNIPKEKSVAEGVKDETYKNRILDKTYNRSILHPEFCPLFHSFFSCPLLALYVSPKSYFRFGSTDNVKWEFLETMKDSWKVWSGEKMRDTTRLHFEFKARTTSKPRGEFVNLHPLLNSVPVLQGQE